MADVLITVNGQPHTVAINGFETMAPDEQVRAMHYVATYLGAPPASAPTAPPASATPAPAPASAPAAPPFPDYQDSYFSDAQQGLHNAATGIGSTLDEGGKLAARNGADGVGSAASAAGGYFKGAVPAVQGYQSPSARLVQAVKEGRYLDAAQLVPHAAVEGGADLAGTLGSAVAGGAVAGPVGAAAGAVGYGVARNAGENAEARAANAGRAEPTTSDLIASAPGTALEAGLGALGANKLPGVSSVVDNIGSRIARGAVKTALEGTGAAGASAASDLAQGNDIDPYKAAVAAAQGASARAVGEVPGAVREGAQVTSDRILSGLQKEPKSTDAATADADAANLYQQFAAQAAQTKDSSPTAVLKSTRDALKSALQDYAANLKDKGLIDQGAKQNLATLIRQGGTHNNTIVEGPDTNFDALNDMGLSDEHLAVVQRGLRALDSLSDGSLLKNTTGPLQTLGGAAARVGALGEAYQHAGPLGAIVAAAGATHHGLYDRVGQNVGRLGDQALGLSTPTILLRAAKAKRYLAARDVAGPDDTALQAVQRANAGIPDIVDPGPGPVQSPTPAELRANIANARAAYRPDPAAPPPPEPVQPPSPADLRAGIRTAQAAYRPEPAPPPGPQPPAQPSPADLAAGIRRASSAYTPEPAPPPGPQPVQPPSPADLRAGIRTAQAAYAPEPPPPSGPQSPSEQDLAVGIRRAASTYTPEPAPPPGPQPVQPPSPADLRAGIRSAASAYTPTPEAPVAPPTAAELRLAMARAASAPRIEPAATPATPSQADLQRGINRAAAAPVKEAPAAEEATPTETETGLPVSPVPVNTPLTKAGAVKGQRKVSKTKVAEAVSAATPNPVTAVTKVPAETLVAQAMGTSPSPAPLPHGHTLATKYLAMQRTDQPASRWHEATQAAEAAGVVPPGTAALVAHPNLPLPLEHAKAIRKFEATSSKEIGMPSSGPEPVRNPIAYQAAVDQAIASEAHVRTTSPHLGALVNDIVGTGQEGKSAAARKAAFDAIDKSSLSPADVAALKSLTKFGKK